MQSHFENFQASLRCALPYPPKCDIDFACASPLLFSESIVAEMHQQIKFKRRKKGILKQNQKISFKIWSIQEFKNNQKKIWSQRTRTYSHASIRVANVFSYRRPFTHYVTRTTPNIPFIKNCCSLSNSCLNNLRGQIPTSRSWNYQNILFKLLL